MAGLSIVAAQNLVELVDIARGALLGRKNAVQVVTSKPVRPCSCAIASSGISSVRPHDGTAIAFTCLPVINGAAAPRLQQR